jgi:[glutamine synthetase] adenylyltransferase / [glutamine synthetase]-adenylyl-L-tyrosine phosphorylase
MRAEFSAIGFLDAAKAQGNLAGLEKQLAPTLIAPLASLLEHSPDPDGALNLLERYAERAPAEVLADIARYPTSLTYLVAIFGHSAYLAETLLAEPDLVVQFARDRHFTQLKSREDVMQDYARFSTTNPDHWLSAQLARFKRRNYLRIVLKDVLGLSTLGETTFELSTLADVILSNALSFCALELEKRYGHPQFRDAQGRIVRSGFSIISLGKLGGNELNYSSDIDLLFLYSRDGETSGGNEKDSTISNKEFFVRLAHAVTRTITQSTHHGEVFRVDLRLRPEGDQGDLAISLNSAGEYYEHRARDWELQMLIKARHSAGEAHLTREFLRRVEEYVYATPGDVDAVESVLTGRERISQKLLEGDEEAPDIKLHRGGIRDIEFLTQCLQRLYGRNDPWVRSGGTLFALRKLNDKGLLPDSDFAVLTSSYEFFRKVEHRVQLEMGKQTHRLPADREALDRLARRVGSARGRATESGAALLSEIRRRFALVKEIYERSLHPRRVMPQGESFELRAPETASLDACVHSLEGMTSFLSARAPQLAEQVQTLQLGERAQRNVAKFLAAVLGSAERFENARAGPARFRRALEVSAASEFLGEILIHHPEELAALDSTPTRAAGESQAAIPFDASVQIPPFSWVSEENLDSREKMALLRRDFRSRALALGAADLLEWKSIYPALVAWSVLAERAIASALQIAAGSLGLDTSQNSGGIPLVVLGLGRLGLSEFDLASDADLVFVLAGPADHGDMSPWAKLAEKTIEVLSSYTRDGTVFVVDTRLRPRGQEGELVITEESLITYLRESAAVWEGLTYLKATPVAGDGTMAQRVAQRANSTCVERFSNHAGLQEEMQRMRRRLETEVIVPPSNLKTVPGGYYDVDFLVSLLRLRARLELNPGVSMRGQIEALRDAGSLDEATAGELIEGAAFLRSVDHAVRLVTGKAMVGFPEHVGHAEAVENLARRWGLVADGRPLTEAIYEQQQKIRRVYRKTFGPDQGRKGRPTKAAGT